MSKPYMILAHILREDGRPNTILIPPRNTRLFLTDTTIEVPEDCMLLCSASSPLLLKSVLCTTPPLFKDEIIVIALYNGSLDSVYIKHEDWIASGILVPQYKEKSNVMVPSVPPLRSGFKTS